MTLEFVQEVMSQTWVVLCPGACLKFRKATKSAMEHQTLRAVGPQARQPMVQQTLEAEMVIACNSKHCVALATTKLTKDVKIKTALVEWEATYSRSMEVQW